MDPPVPIRWVSGPERSATRSLGSGGEKTSMVRGTAGGRNEPLAAILGASLGERDVCAAGGWLE